MYTTDVGFIPKESVLDVRPQIHAGKLNSVWVSTPSNDEASIKEAAQNKMMQCYGIEIEDITVYEGSQFET